MKSNFNLLNVIMTFALFNLAGYCANAQGTGGSATSVATINSKTHTISSGEFTTGLLQK